MQDREILNDLLGGTKASINCYTTAIVECSNQQLRSTLQTLRNEAEQMQYQLYQMAEKKGYYMAAPQAQQNDVQKVKSVLSSSNNMNMSNSTQNSNMSNSTSNIYSGSTNNNTNPSMTSTSNQNMTNSTNRGMTSSTNQSMTNSTNGNSTNKLNSKNRH